MLRLVLATAQAEGAIRANPCDGVRVPPSPKADMVFLTAEQVEALAVAIDAALRHPHPPRRLHRHARRRDRRPARRPSRPRQRPASPSPSPSPRSRATASSSANRRPTSAARSRSPTFLTDELADHLEDRPDDPDAFVFTSPDGDVLNHKNFYRRTFKPAVARRRLPARTRFHDLRHTCAALCIALGAHPKAIQERLGHSSITVTLDRYGHLFPKLDETLTDRLDDLHSACIIR